MIPEDEFIRSHLTATGAAMLAIQEIEAARDMAVRMVDHVIATQLA
jgi:ribosomal protein L16/L10AE